MMGLVMLNPDVYKIVACPACRGDLNPAGSVLVCESCEQSYPSTGGIPCLYPPQDALAIDPAKLRIKSNDEAARTITDTMRMDYGFIAKTRAFYAIYALLILAVVLGSVWGIAVIGMTLLADWFVFRSRRGRILAELEHNPLRLTTVADHEAVDALYDRAGQPQPTMSDWVRLAGKTSGVAPEPNTSPIQDDERYRDIRRAYERMAPPPNVIVDVGSNDGRAYYEFGVGRGRTFIGIDVSRLLLEEFLERVPDQTALQADGVYLPLKDDSVDFLFCTETLEHLADPGAAIREFTRVLRPGGRLMVQSPNAHRLRNLNVFHVLTLAVSLFTDRVLQKKIVHENTWHNGITYHWDFSTQDYRRMATQAGAKVIELRSSNFFFPSFLLRGRRDLTIGKERSLASIPLIRFLGGDLVMVAEKPKRAVVQSTGH